MDIASVMDIKIETVGKVCSEVGDRIVKRNYKSNGTGEDKKESEKIDILELSNPINDKKITNIEEDRAKLDISIADTVNEEQIKRAVRDAVASLPQSKLDQIINEELTKIIQERLNSSKIIISTENKKN